MRNNHDDNALLRLRHGDAEARSRLAALAAEDADLRDRLADWDRQDAALHALYDPVIDEPLPPRLTALLANAGVRPPHSRWPLRIAAMAAMLVLGLAAGWTGARLTDSGQGSDSLVASALRAHQTYVVEVAHPVEIPASDETHMTKWLSKRLGHPIAPPDLAAMGFRLVGGRVLPDARGAAALMMYEDDLGQRITLYIAPEPGGAESAFRFTGQGSTQGFWWVDDKLGCALLGDLPRDRLQSIATSVYGQLTGA